MKHRVLVRTVGIAAAAAAALGAAGGSPPPGPEADPAIAFVGSAGGLSGKLCVMNADGTNAAAIFTSPSLNPRNPDWNPGGTSIVFEIPTGFPEVWRVDVSLVNGVPKGSNGRRLLGGDGVPYYDPAWSPLGNAIAVRRGTISSPGGNSILLVPEAGGPPTLLYEPPGGPTSAGVGHLAWSPDGGRLAFIEGGVGGVPYGIKVLDIATGLTTTALDGVQYPLHPQHLDWAPTFNAMAFQNSSSGTVYTLDLDSGVPAPLAQPAWTPSWSPDGARLVYGAANSRIKQVNLVTNATTTLAPRGTYPEWRR